MSFRTNPDRILDSIDRERNREDMGLGYIRAASSRELGTELPDMDATHSERVRRVFKLVEKAYTDTASGAEIRRLAERFQTVGDISNHHARGDVSVSVAWLDHARSDDVAMVPFEIRPSRLDEVKKESRTSRADANALRILREELRNGVMGAYKKLEPRLRDAVQEKADLGHVEVQVTVDLRPGS